MEAQPTVWKRGKTKRGLGECKGVGRMGEYCCFAKVYSCFFARARDLLNISLFFLD
jgi:hypothetical protein